MTKLDESSLGLRLRKLMQDKLGPNLDWAPPEIQDIVGPFEPNVFHAHDEKRQHIVYECQKKLASFSDAQVLVLCREIKDDPGEVVNEWTGFLRDEIYGLNKSLPPWYAGGFGHPDYQADFEYWSQLRHLTAHEALMLSLGLEPTHFAPKDIAKISDPKLRQGNLPKPLQFLVRRREQIDRQFPRPMNYDRIKPQEFFEWVQQVDLKIHPKFTSRYLTGLDAMGDKEVTPTAKRPDKREVDKIAQLFTAMAISELGYRPGAARSPIPKEIADLAANMGLEISEDTIRKYLKIGASFLPAGWEPDG